MDMLHTAHQCDLVARFAALMENHPELAKRKACEAAEKLGISPEELEPLMDVFKH